MTDIRDILDIEKAPTEALKDSILGTSDKFKTKKNASASSSRLPKRPEGMPREVYALLCVDRKDVPPLLPTDTGIGYKHEKAKLGMRKVRPWKWTPFTNPARRDNAVFYHWRRAADECKEYPFAQFNKQVDIPKYTDTEYTQHLKSDDWTKEETDHLFDLCLRFDRRFIVVHDRFDHEKYKKRDVEDLKERFYSVSNILKKIRHNENVPFHEPKAFDAEHERRRKEQLNRLFSRTPEQIEEEQMLTQELRKIDARKKEREKKTQDLQKLITGNDSPVEPRKQERRTAQRKRFQSQVKVRSDANVNEVIGIKFPDHKSSGANTRTSRMRLPANVGQKKTKIIEAKLKELNLELNPIPTEEVCILFNELRNDIIVLNEIKNALSTCMFEIQSFKHQYEAYKPEQTLVIPEIILKLDDDYMETEKS